MNMTPGKLIRNPIIRKQKTVPGLQNSVFRRGLVLFGFSAPVDLTRCRDVQEHQETMC
jgi:hypothetical protein